MRTALIVLGIVLSLVIAACGGDDGGDGGNGGSTFGCDPPPVAEGAHPELDEGLAAIVERTPTRPCDPMPAGYHAEEVVSGLDFPLAMAFAPDGRIFVTERVTGRVRIVRDGELLPEPFLQVDNLFTMTASGLLGITLDPDFENNGYVYVSYTEQDGAGGEFVIERYTDQDGQGVDPVRLLEGVPGDVSGQHLAGNMEFGPDGKLYVALGDTCGFAEPDCDDRGQDLSTPAGSILRLNPDGSAPEDNPFVDDLEADNRIFAYGLRNPFDFDINHNDGTIIAQDNGPERDDEINLIQAGGNYGWPIAVGQAGDPQFIDPIIAYGRILAPAGLAIYTGDRLEAFQNEVFFCQFVNGGLLHRMQLTPTYDGVVSDEVIAGSCTSDVQTGPDGNLYFMELVSGTIYRITNEADPAG